MSTIFWTMPFDSRSLIDSAEVAAIIGLARSTSVSTYRYRYNDFPQPHIEKGKCVLWLRSEIEQWSAGHRRQRGPVPQPRK
jgi:predicted DNA-binding transcriptional regulator AlpA